MNQLNFINLRLVEGYTSNELQNVFSTSDCSDYANEIIESISKNNELSKDDFANLVLFKAAQIVSKIYVKSLFTRFLA